MKKKMLLAASLVLVSGGLSACGNKGEKSTGTVKNAVHRNAESREDKAVNKALDAFSALKEPRFRTPCMSRQRREVRRRTLKWTWGWNTM